MKKLGSVSVVAFVLGVLGVNLHVRKVEREVRGGEIVETLVVTKDIQAGEVLTEGHVGVMGVPSDYADARRITARDKANVIGVEVSLPLRAGEALVWSDLSDGEANKHLAALVTPGMRAYSLEGKANPLGDLLRVGDLVDVLLEKSGDTEMLLQGVVVLAVGGRIEAAQYDEKKRTRSEGVTLSVTGNQAQVLLGAEARGDLRLVLRNPDDAGRQDPPAGDDRVATRTAKASTEKKTEIEHVR